jgi:endonuclease/exonuclease/phosphatase family metal-dependent hydrolase
MKLRILSYNIHKGFTLGNRAFVLEKIRSALRILDADIIFLQEVVGVHGHEKHRIPDWTSSIQFEYLADAVWNHFAYGKNAVYTEGHHGNAILSKFPILKWSNHAISDESAEVRGLLKAHIQLPNGGNEIVLANTHLGLTQKGRNEQTQIILKHMGQQSSLPWIMVGDFNDWNKKVSRVIEKDLKAVEAFKSLHGKYPLTYPSILPMLSLDRIFLHNIKPLKAMRLLDAQWKRLSDHLPLYVELELR